MPLIRVSHPVDAFSPEAKDKIAEGLTAVLLDVEGGYDTPSGRALAYVVFVPIGRQDWYIGGHSGGDHQRGPERIVVDVTVPEAATTQENKAEIYQRIHALFADALGWPADEPNPNAWIIMHEVPEGSWGIQGETFGIRRLAEYVSDGIAKPDENCVAFVTGYFKAKGKAYETAGYPEDVSGLMEFAG